MSNIEKRVDAICQYILAGNVVERETCRARLVALNAETAPPFWPQC